MPIYDPNISEEDLKQVPIENLLRLAKYLKLKIEPNMNKDALARRIYWNIVPVNHSIY